MTNIIGKCDIASIEAYRGKYTYSLCVWTDRTDMLLNETDALSDTDKLLDIRCFDEKGEFYACRSSVNADFTAREITDDSELSFDESHYLDIDSAKTENEKDGYVYATGGGRYNLPVKNAEKIIVRFYYDFDSNGIARKRDWRLVGFEVKEGK